jgi:hypothetical protein
MNKKVQLSTITTWIESNTGSILENLKESIAVYNFLQARFQQKEDVTKDLLFQFVFRSFYSLDNAGLGAPFKTRYFELMEECRDSPSFNFASVLRPLYDIETLKGKNTFQFSFVTKMLSTIDPQRPVYDREVARMFGYTQLPGGEFADKFKIYLDRYQHIEDSYRQILSDNLLPATFSAFDEAFPQHDLSDVKRLDFIFWAAGKVKAKGKSADAEEN